MPSIFETITLGATHCRNRVAMAPLTRNRSSQPGNVPNDLMAQYYAQRAGFGLIVSEATQISPQGQGYLWAPGIHSTAQAEGWQRVTRAVHQAGGRMVLQLWHVGRVSHQSVLPDGMVPVSPSGIGRAGLHTWALRPDGTPGKVECSPPRALEAHEIRQTIQDYVRAAQLALEAGFDGVEIHAANGYLIEQFMDPTANVRTDEWGGSMENRARFARQVYTAVSSAIGAARTGIRLSPGAGHGGKPVDPAWRDLALHLAAHLRGAMYVHLFDHTMGQEPPQAAGCGRPFAAEFRSVFGGPIILNGGFGSSSWRASDAAHEAQAALDAGLCDMVAFGKLAISNPDLVARLKGAAAEGAPLLNQWDSTTFYGGGAAGYTDYPALAGHAVVG
ncbi:MAG: alkene reductase [Phycisphaerales bacterium]